MDKNKGAWCYSIFESIAAEHLDEQLDKPNSTTTKKGQQPTCPLCGSELVRTGRCNLCMGCGWSSCEAVIVSNQWTGKDEREKTHINTTIS